MWITDKWKEIHQHQENVTTDNRVTVQQELFTVDSSGKDMQHYALIAAEIDKIKRRLHYLEGIEVEKLQALYDEVESLKALLA